MKTLKFKCTLLSDVILNQKAATEGPNQTLDFIPGNCFLGIVASELYPTDKDKAREDYAQRMSQAMKIFHSGKIRFGDAHPSQGNMRGLKVPASMYYPKLSKPSEKLYIHHAIKHFEELKTEQPKQCRSGFYDFSSPQATRIKTDTNFAIKSAYDRCQRRSKDEQMFGYESLQKGLELFFEVQIDNDSLADVIRDALVGENKRVGRSRTAQYGLVKIEEWDYKEIQSETSENGLVIVYADGRLVFLDDFGLPVYRPSVKQLGLPDGAKIVWEKSQIRTFQYAPWNFKRQCFDADRCGIEKGSVFVVDVAECKALPELASQYVGSYCNEGFGKVIYNPKFLQAEPNANGLALFKLVSPQVKHAGNEANSEQMKGTILLQYIGHQLMQEQMESTVYEMVNEWVALHKGIFKGEAFASQWRTIRSIAMQNKKLCDLKSELFEKTKVDRYGKSVSDAYLTHGVAADKWKERGRLKLFKEFVEKLSDENAQVAIINLASEMQKECRKENK